MESSTHRRNLSIKASRPRSSTKGPLDAPEEIPTSPLTSSNRSSLQPDDKSKTPPTTETKRLSKDAPSPLPINRDFSYLLRPEIYHPLSQLEIPSAFRSEFLSSVPGQSLDSLLRVRDELTKNGRFLQAAHLSAAILTSKLVGSTDYQTIFSLLYTRLACLDLTGNTILAAQESKALEDLTSAFYHVDPDDNGLETDNQSHSKQPRHLVPWELRVIAVRLQSIGFGDPRRRISGLYELGLQARKQILFPTIGSDEKALWKERLADLGIRVVNALIEMGDFDAARRSLANISLPAPNAQETARMILLHLRVGDVSTAKSLLSTISEHAGGIYGPLLEMAEGRYDDAISSWNNLRGSHSRKDDEALILQNLAVCLLYVGKLTESREIMESLVDQHYSFQSLSFNLSTVYELCSENSQSLKLQLTERISSHPFSEHQNWERPNANFKI
ncbi:hypothetical protein FQN57_000073 [Myotisia sp. PD_48]|nr:hypothetical protein FQN57_000073 [Myotisia sp. PD_48]